MKNRLVFVQFGKFTSAAFPAVAIGPFLYSNSRAIYIYIHWECTFFQFGAMDETFPPVKASGNEDGRSKNSPYYLKTVGDKLTGPMKDILENYSGIPSDQVERHVYELVSSLMYTS